MEFGIFVMMNILGQDAHKPGVEYATLRSELDLIRAADKSGWKYVWVTEHHCLPEYSHLSANESFIPYALAITENIHVGSGIFNTNPIVNHPVRIAERVAMLDLLSSGRFEFGTGRGAGSWEVGTFNLKTSETKEVWDEVIWEFKKMWESREYSFDGRFFQTPPRNILPKPYGGGKTHPPMWVAAGNPPTFEKAARHGLGVLGFNVEAAHAMKDRVDAYRAVIKDATPVGQYVNNNVMISSSMLCLEDGKRARQVMADSMMSYFFSLLFLYHDTFPIPEGAVRWPAVNPEPGLEGVEEMIESGMIVCGDPHEVKKQLEAFEYIGIDQLVFGGPNGIPFDVQRESIELFAREVMPHFDKNPGVWRTTQMRQGAAVS
jgi:alkanesulfonate monooxygenase SsuD/methylene tetrahydromethanopterin reductase-like flavin-dependent oxidoreductase (luciferase family)